MTKKTIPIYHTILYMTEQAVLDRVMIMCFERIFVWANQAGLDGIKVEGLKFIEPKPESAMSDPLNNKIAVRCIKHVTEEQYNTTHDQYKKSWQEYARDLGIDEHFLDEYLDERSKKHREKHDG